ncbi:hypothetical protein RM697_09300 [Ichthyenterobacterium sp. W332]|uniref:T9SS C-terminal target domain-containing protein n=1 Tax=Microcosmobacter mediterraneus TaxID=3075607 RepID=A0ABU2YL05_9FLAO|nr:hypothetical protein [Ichthyenterobacterium sp. W332]MDT0558844.1 hypothetical protein [Ichthyenterobacterium sp. W332]
MKKFTLLTLVFTLVCSYSFSQQEKGIIGYNNWLNPWTEFKPNKVEYGKPTQILSGDITKDTKLYKRDIYLLLGDVFVTDSTTLTIEPGTVIIGDFKTKGSLTISKDSKIIADGTHTDPIIFTSSRSVKKPGDWGGIFILGDAPTSKFGNEASLNYGLRPSDFESISYGGENIESDSGIFRYVRIEYAGKRTKSYGYFNALTLAGVGQQTIVENIMVSYCEGNSFNVLGGNVILERLISYKSNNNDYEFNYGTQCNLINSLAIRSPYVSGSDVSRCIMVNAYEDIEDADLTKKQTNVEAENLTLINLSSDLENDIKIGLVNEAIYVGNDTSFSIDKSVISGFNPAVIFDSKIKINNENLNKISFTRTYFNNCKGNIFRKGFSNNDDLESWYGSRAFDNVYSKGPDSETFIDSHNSKRPDFRLRINRIIASNDLIDDDDD